jgi:hypothetical protein
MTKYIKSRDGKFAGSIGDGKHTVPTSAPVLTGSPTGAAAAADGYRPIMESAYERFKRSQQMTTDQARQMVVIDDPSSDGNAAVHGYQYQSHIAEGPSGTWHASIYEPAGHQNVILSEEQFATRQQALDWATDETAERYRQLVNFRRLRTALAEDSHTELKQYAAENGAQWSTIAAQDHAGRPVTYVQAGVRQGIIAQDGESGRYISSVFLSDGDRFVDSRVEKFANYDEAVSFAEEKAVRGW